MNAPSPALAQMVLRAGQLYSLPAVAVRVLELTRDPDRVDMRQLKACLEQDPALAAKVLSVVNSSLFGLSKQVCDLNQALALLGVKPLKLLLLGFSLPKTLFVDVAHDTLRRYWQRALTRAVAARSLAEALFHQGGDEAFLAGLLRDLGQLVLIQQLAEPYVRLVARAAREQADLLPLETASLGFDHFELTAALLRRWELPESLILAVQPNLPAARLAHLGSAERQLIRTVHLAESAAALLVDRRLDAWEALRRATEETRPAAVDHLPQILGDVQDKVRQLADVLSLDLPGDLNYHEIVESAHRQLVELAADVAGQLVASRHAATAEGREPWLDSADAQDLSHAIDTWRTETLKAVVATRPEKKAASPSRPAAASAVVSDQTAAVQDDPALVSQLRMAAVACRQARRPLSLALIELDRHADLVFQYGLEGTRRILDWIVELARELDHEGAQVFFCREARLALILPDCDRAQAASLAHQLIRSVRRLTSGEGAEPAEARPLATVSIGASTVPLAAKNFAPQELVACADRCLYAARASGGDSAKTLELH